MSGERGEGQRDLDRAQHLDLYFKAVEYKLFKAESPVFKSALSMGKSPVQSQHKKY